MIYVDDMRAPLGDMVMCHMMADTTAELLAFADRLGLARRWLQKPGKPQEHFDLSAGKRRRAVQLGAIEVTRRDLGHLVRKRQGRSFDPDCVTCRPPAQQDLF